MSHNTIVQIVMVDFNLNPPLSPPPSFDIDRADAPPAYNVVIQSTDYMLPTYNQAVGILRRHVRFASQLNPKTFGVYFTVCLISFACFFAFQLMTLSNATWINDHLTHGVCVMPDENIICVPVHNLTCVECPLCKKTNLANGPFPLDVDCYWYPCALFPSINHGYCNYDAFASLSAKIYLRQITYVIPSLSMGVMLLIIGMFMLLLCAVGVRRH